MRKSIKIIASFAAIILLMSTFSIIVNAELVFDGFCYSVENNEITITGYKGYDSSLIIPQTIDGYNVTTIGQKAFFQNTYIESVTLPNTITTLEDSAFYGCYNISSINIPNSIKIIGNWVFFWCKNIEKITIPNSVRYIGEYAFRASGLAEIDIPDSVNFLGCGIFSLCDKLEKIKLPNSLESISTSMFLQCTNLQSITLPDSIEKIDQTAFQHCTSLINIEIPQSVAEINSSAFIGCLKLQSISVNNKNLYYESVDGVLFDKTNDTLIKYPSGKTEKFYSVPESVTKIGFSAFENSDSLTSVLLPKSTVFIDTSAFDGCKKLMNIYYCSNEESWNNIRISDGNNILLITNIYYDCCPVFLEESHKYESMIIPPSCVEKGYTTFICECGASYDSDYVNSKGHSYSSSISKNASCTETGYISYECLDCKDTYTEKLPKLGHNFSNEFTVDIVATYLEFGSKSKHCLRKGCTAKSEVTVIPKLVPEFTDSKDAKESGNDIISNNGLTVAQLLSQAGKDAVIKTADGKSVENAALIGTGMVLTMADGSKKEIVVYGDVDGDGKISAADARQALRASVGLENFKEDSAKYKAAKRGSLDKLSAADARLILRASVGLEDPKSWIK